MTNYQLCVWLKFISKGAFLEAQIYYQMAVIENNRKQARGIRPK